MKLKFWEKFKGFFVSGGPARKRKSFWLGEKSWSDRCKYVDQIYEDHPLAKAQILTVAGQLIAEGVFTEVAYEDGPHQTRSEEAKDKCDDFNERIGLDTMLYETAVRMAKYGSCFWEKTSEPVFDVRLHPNQELIEPKTLDATEGVTVWRQTDGYKEVAEYGENDLIHFAWNITPKTFPYGTSLLTGLDTVFETLDQLRTDIKEHMHHSAFPYELYQVGDGQYMPDDAEVSAIRSSVKKWKPGEKHVTSYPIDLKTGGTGDKPVSNLNDILNYLKDECIDGLMVPPISKQWSSTMASATEMLPWAQANLIRPMQRIIKRKIEHDVYQPYLESLDYSVKVTPKLEWEAPDAHKDEEAEYWALQVQSGIVPAEYAAMEQGFDMDKIKKFRDEQAQREEEAAQLGKTFPISPGQGVRQKIQPEEKKE